MPEKVIKRDGNTEPFIPEKVVVSCLKAGAPVETGRKITEEIKELEGTIKTKKIREEVLDRLEDENREWKQNWLTYDREVKKRQ